MPFAAQQKEIVALNIKPALGAIAVAVLGLGVQVLIDYDRRAPYEYIDTIVTPSVAVEGQFVTLHRRGIWHRRCVGDAWREVVKPNGEITSYVRGYTRLPTEDEIGNTTEAESRFELPPAMIAKTYDSGNAVIRGTIRFSDCGLTSRWLPIDIKFQTVAFTVLHSR